MSYDFGYSPTLPPGFGSSSSGGDVAGIISALGTGIAQQAEAWYPYMPGYIDYEGQAGLAAAQASADMAQAQIIAAQAQAAQSSALATALAGTGAPIDPLIWVGLGVGVLGLIFVATRKKK